MYEPVSAAARRGSSRHVNSSDGWPAAPDPRVAGVGCLLASPSPPARVPSSTGGSAQSDAFPVSSDGRNTQSPGGFGGGAPAPQRYYSQQLLQPQASPTMSSSRSPALSPSSATERRKSAIVASLSNPICFARQPTGQHIPGGGPTAGAAAPPSGGGGGAGPGAARSLPRVSALTEAVSVAGTPGARMTRVHLPELARRLHVPVEALAQSLSRSFAGESALERAATSGREGAELPQPGEHFGGTSVPTGRRAVPLHSAAVGSAPVPMAGMAAMREAVAAHTHSHRFLHVGSGAVVPSPRPCYVAIGSVVGRGSGQVPHNQSGAITARSEGVASDDSLFFASAWPGGPAQPRQKGKATPPLPGTPTDHAHLRTADAASDPGLDCIPAACVRSTDFLLPVANRAEQDGGGSGGLLSGLRRSFSGMGSRGSSAGGWPSPASGPAASRDVPCEQEALLAEDGAKRKVRFRDEGADHLVTSVLEYDEIGTIFVEVRYRVPASAWFALLVCLAASCLVLPLQVSAHERDTVSYTAVLLGQVLFELLGCVTIALLAAAQCSSCCKALLRRENLIVLVTAGLAHAGYRGGALAAFSSARRGCSNEACPPMLPQGLGPVLAACWYVCSARCRPAVDADAGGIYITELMGIVLLCSGQLFLAGSQLGGLSGEALPLAAAAALGLVLELLLTRAIAPHVALAPAVALMRAVGALCFLVAVLWGGDDWSEQAHRLSDAGAAWLLAALFACVEGLCLFGALRHMHVYGVSACYSFAAVVISVVTGPSIGSSWGGSGKSSIPSLLLCAVGAGVTIWATVHHRSEVVVEIPQYLDAERTRRKPSGIKDAQRRKSRGDNRSLSDSSSILSSGDF